MVVVVHGKLNLYECPTWGSRSVDCFKKLEQISEGTYGDHRNKQEYYFYGKYHLWKIRMDNEREGFPITAIREIKFLKKLHHENVIKLKEIVTSTGLEKDEQGKPGSNLLIDNEGNLKLADFGLARSFSNNHNGNLTNRVITLWYRPPELLLGTTKYGPAVDMWFVGCIFAELLQGKPILPGKDEPEQLNKIFELCGPPDEVNWPGVSKFPWYNNFKPTRPVKRRLKEAFRYDRHAVELLDKMMTLDPSQRISAKDALDAEYFWTDPLPSKRQKLQHSRVPPNQQSGHPQLHPGANQPIHNSQAPGAAEASHHHGKPRGPSGGPSRYSQGGNPSGGFNPNRASQGGGGYNAGPYPPSSQGPGGSNYGFNCSTYPPQNGPYPGGNNSKSHQQHYGWAP
ncbi:hypothetical protein MKX01_021201 [Papaver californicum]|nr:hypothetical protein MKX01_021201 [Papaver californicum]